MPFRHNYKNRKERAEVGSKVYLYKDSGIRERPDVIPLWLELVFYGLILCLGDLLYDLLLEYRRVRKDLMRLLTLRRRNMKPKFETIGQIKLGNPFFTYGDTPISKIADDLLHSRWSGMPVIDGYNRVIGMVSEQDLLRALRGTRPLEEIIVKEIMTRSPVVIKEKATLEEASKIMENTYIHRLPVVKDGGLVGTVTRHDLLRAWLGVSVEEV